MPAPALAERVGEFRKRVADLLRLPGGDPQSSFDRRWGMARQLEDKTPFVAREIKELKGRAKRLREAQEDRNRSTITIPVTKEDLNNSSLPDGVKGAFQNCLNRDNRDVLVLNINDSYGTVGEGISLSVIGVDGDNTGKSKTILRVKAYILPEGHKRPVQLAVSVLNPFPASEGLRSDPFDTAWELARFANGLIERHK